MDKCRKCGKMFKGIGKLCPDCEAEVSYNLDKGRKLFNRHGLEDLDIKYDIDNARYECTNCDGHWLSYNGENWIQSGTAKALSVKYKPSSALETDMKEVELRGFPLDIAKGFVKNDSGKLQWSLLPFAQLEDVVKVLMVGAEKYSRDNWKNCDDINRYKDALMRHVTAYIKGEKTDIKDKGGDDLPHLAHAICNCLFLMYFDEMEDKKDVESE